MTRRHARVVAVMAGIVIAAARAQGAASVSILTPGTVSLTTTSRVSLTVVARGGNVSIERVLSRMNDETTGQFLEPFTPLPAPIDLKADVPQDVTLAFRPELIRNVTSGKGSLVLLYREPNTPPALTAGWDFVVLRASPQISVASDPILVVRPTPFRRFTVAPDEGACVSYWPTRREPIINENTTFDGYLTGADGNNATAVSATVRGHRLCISAVIPGSQTQLKGQVHLAPPDVQIAVDPLLQVNVKDATSWRVAAAVVSALVGLLLVYWTGTVKKRLLNQSTRDDLTERLAQFLTEHPDLSEDASVQLIRHLLVTSKLQDRLQQFDAAAQTLQDVASRITTLQTSPPAQATSLAASPQTPIRIANPSNSLEAGRTLTFVLAQPAQNWPRGATYEWSIARDGGKPIPIESGTELKTVRYIVPQAGSYDITVSALDATKQPVQPLVTRSFTVATMTPRTIAQRFEWAQALTMLFAFVLAAASAYVLTDTPTFGAVADYVKLVGTAVGVSGGAGSFTTILAATRG